MKLKLITIAIIMATLVTAVTTITIKLDANTKNILSNDTYSIGETTCTQAEQGLFNCYTVLYKNEVEIDSLKFPVFSDNTEGITKERDITLSAKLKEIAYPFTPNGEWNKKLDGGDIIIEK